MPFFDAVDGRDTIAKIGIISDFAKFFGKKLAAGDGRQLPATKCPSECHPCLKGMPSTTCPDVIYDPKR
jgi:hypothetical protein